MLRPKSSNEDFENALKKVRREEPSGDPNHYAYAAAVRFLTHVTILRAR